MRRRLNSRRELIAGMRVAFVLLVSEAVCAMCAICVCIRVCVGVGLWLWVGHMYMYPGQHKHSTKPIWLSQSALLRAPTPFLNFRVNPSWHEWNLCDWRLEWAWWTFRRAVNRREGGRVNERNKTFGLKVPYAPKWFDFEFPILQTTKLFVETCSCTWAKRVYLYRLLRSCRAPVTTPWGLPALCTWAKRIYLYRLLRNCMHL